HFRRVNATGDQNDCLTARDESRCFLIRIGSQFSWICEFLLNTSVLVQASEIFRRTYDGHDELLIHCRLAERLKLHTIARTCQLIEVCKHLIPARKLSIIARRKTEDVLRRRDRWNAESNRACRVPVSKTPGIKSVCWYKNGEYKKKYD